MEKCHLAPYDHGEKTILDESHGAFGLFMCKLRYDFEWHGNDMECFDTDTEELGEDQSLTKVVALNSPWVAYAPTGADTQPTQMRVPEVEADVLNEVAPVDFFGKKLQCDGQNEQMYTGNEGSVLEKWYTSAALVVVPVMEMLKLQFAVDPIKTLTKQWLPLVESNPALATFAAVSLGTQQQQAWSLVSANGQAVLEGVKRLEGLAALQGLLQSCLVVQFQPKTRDLVAVFDWDAVVSTVQAIVHSYSKGSGQAKWYVARNAVDLVASVLNGEHDPTKIEKLLAAVPLEASVTNMGDPWGDRDTTPEAFARVLVAAYKVSMDQLATVVAGAAKKKNEFNLSVLVVAPALRKMIETLGGEDAKQKTRPLIQKLHDELEVALPAIFQDSYRRCSVYCPAARSRYGYHEVAICDACHTMVEFLKSPGDHSLSMKKSQFQEAHLPESTKKMLTIESNDQEVTITKSFESAFYRKASAELEALSKLWAP